jgi:DNA-binding MarR family transcriptional regulator
MSDKIREIASLDRMIHEPSRLAIVAVLSACESADFNYLLNATGLTKGNLSAQLSKLEEAKYIQIAKGFKGKYPHTQCALTAEGRRAFKHYWEKYQALADHLTDMQRSYGT